MPKNALLSFKKAIQVHLYMRCTWTTKNMIYILSLKLDLNESHWVPNWGWIWDSQFSNQLIALPALLSHNMMKGRLVLIIYSNYILVKYTYLYRYISQLWEWCKTISRINYEILHNLCTLPKEFDHVESTFFTKYTFSVAYVGKEVPVQVRCVIYNVRIYLYIVCNIV